MRLRGKLVQPAFQHFADVVTAISKVSRLVVLSLSAKQIRLFGITDDDHLWAWATLKTPTTFQSLHIESRADNEVFLETGAVLLASAMESGTSSFAHVRLISREGQAYLSLEMQPPQSGLMVCQDVPVTVLSPRDMERYAEPMITPPEVTLLLRSELRPLRVVVDRLKNLDRFLALEADMKGNLSVKIENEMVAIKTYFRDLDPKPTSHTRDLSGRAAVRVQGKRLSKVLGTCQGVSGAFVVCAGPKALVLHVNLERDLGTLTFVLSVVAVDDDEDADLAAADGRTARAGDGGTRGVGVGAGAGAGAGTGATGAPVRAAT